LAGACAALPASAQEAAPAPAAGAPAPPLEAAPEAPPTAAEPAETDAVVPVSPDPVPVQTPPSAAAEPGPQQTPPTAAEPAPPPAPDARSEYGAVAVAPAPGARIALQKLPSNVQRIDAEALRAQHALSLHDALNARLGSVTINDVQSNPLQPDLQYRGFTASPLLGTPQGISVFQNGVRLNEPFGEVMQWDLIPLFALSDIQLAPGNNPVYGLNTLGGALVMHMKDGWTAPGARIEGSVGSFGRYRTTAEYGKSWEDGWAAYAGASLFGEQGFRDHSRSSAQNLYADVRKRGRASRSARA
jgi:outer membrane receptor protein involved in Fe transport